jgi:hypothetical protein
MCGGNCNIERVKICSPSLECLDYVPRIQSATENGTMSGLKHEICTISESGQGTVSKDVFCCKILLKVHKHEIILNFFFDLNQILICPS